ncbi:MAG: Ig-like domain-containing protein, partial [Scandinavium sp.]|uniref:Ig-like domain-containing protein n=1 Tax=Scandinavium sp. TaxID=2830653 RepID=UPI003F395DB0
KTAPINVTVDTTTHVTITGVTDDHGSKQGLVANGGKTDDDSVVLTGTAEPNSTVYIDATGVYGEHYKSTVAVGSDGKWSLLQGYANDGWFSYSVYSVDAAGNQSATATYKVEKVATGKDDTSIPDMATDIHLTDNVSGGIIGGLKNGDVTNDNTPTLSGKAEAGDTVIIYDGSKQIGTTTVKSDGTWSYTPSAQKDGSHSYSAAVQNPDNGNMSAKTTAITVVVDTVCDAPVITCLTDDVGTKQGDVLNGGRTDDKLPLVHGTAEAGSTVSVFVKGPGGNTYNLGTTVADTHGNWTFQMNTSRALGRTGNWTFHATATDIAGNTSACIDNFVVEYTGDGNNGDDTSVPDAPHINSYTDDVGSAKGTNNSGSTTDDTTPTLNGTAAANSTVTIYEGSKVLGTVKAGSDGTWHYTVPAESEGKHTFTATATNTAGNSSAHSSDFVVNIESCGPHPMDCSEHYEGAPLSFWSWTDSYGVTTSSNSGVLVKQQMPGTLMFDEHSKSYMVTYSTQINVDFGASTVDTMRVTTYSGCSFTFYDSDGKVIPTEHVHLESMEPSGNTTLYAFEYWFDPGYSASSFSMYSPAGSVAIGGLHWHAADNFVSSHSVESESLSAVHHDDVVSGIIQLDDHQSHEAKPVQLAHDDLLSQAQQNLFIQDGTEQVAIQGEKGAVLELKGADLAQGTWNDVGQSTVAGVTYDIYQHHGDNMEVLVQHGVDIHLVA